MQIRIGTRGSALALWQAGWVKSALERHHPGLSVDLVKIKTKGDKILDVALSKVGGKGLFVKEIEEALLRGKVDLAVHSMKDVPVKLPQGLIIGAVPAREDRRDALITRQASSWEALKSGARVGTSSLRRQSQLLSMRPDLEIVPIRGNVDTRLRKLKSENLDAVVLAAAGIKRMGLEHRVTQYFPPQIMIPAIGQGALGLEVRQDDHKIQKLISFLKHEPTEIEIAAERSFLSTLEGGCQVPIAAWADLQSGILRMVGMVADVDGSRMVRHQMEGSPQNPEELGRELALHILNNGGRAILHKLLGA